MSRRNQTSTRVDARQVVCMASGRVDVNASRRDATRALGVKGGFRFCVRSQSSVVNE